MMRVIVVLILLTLCGGLLAIDQVVADFMQVVSDIDSLAAQCDSADTPEKQARILFAYDKLMFRLHDCSVELARVYPDYKGENRPEGMLTDEEVRERIVPAVVKIMCVGMDNLEHPFVAEAYRKIERNKDKYNADE